LRDEWRAKAAATRDELDLYWNVFVPLELRFPSSHVAALPPASLLSTQHGQKAVAAATAPGMDRGFEYVPVMRGTRRLYFVGDVTPGSPAAAAGVEPGWEIYALPNGAGPTEVGVFRVAGTPAERLEFETGKGWERKSSDDWQTSDAAFAAEQLRKVEFRHVPAQPITIFTNKDLAGGVRYIRLGSFNYPQALDFVLKELDRAGRAGVVLDLRGNEGGLVAQEMRLLDRLLPENSIVGTRVTTGGAFTTRTGGGAKYTGPLVVLIGPGSASAAECVAAALQDHARATLLGRSTSGQTLTSRTWPLPGGGTLTLPYADVLRPNGKRIDGVGVIPDIPIMPGIEDVRAGRDPVLERALLELAAAAVRAKDSPPPAG